MLAQTEEFYRKLAKNRYNTAFSPLYNRYVKIVEVYSFAPEDCLVKCTIDGYSILFKPEELENYGL